MDHVEKSREYRARTCNFAGFAIMMPFGHLIMDPITIINQFGFIGVIFYSLFCLILFIVGLFFIEIGRDILYNKR